MAGLPKIVLQRLQRRGGGEDHPDANLIAAFGENTLKKDERLRLLSHLAQCSDCREIAAAALPEVEPAFAPARSSGGWLAWPVLRWGAAAACVLVVGVAVGLHYRAQPG